MTKPKVLLVPAWYPATFFKEQMEILEDSFDFMILMGTRNTYGKKSWLKKKFKEKSNFVISKTQQDYFEIEYDFICNLPKFLYNKQEELIDSYFCRLFNIIYKSSKPDIIHIQSLSDTAYFVNRWARANQVPVILTEHILFVRHHLDAFQSLKEKVYESVDKVLLVSNYLYRNLITNGINPNNVEVVGNLVRDEFISFPFDPKQNEEKLSILFVASHLYDKDIEVFFDAIELLLSNGFNLFEVHIVGLEKGKSYLNDDGIELNVQDIICQRNLSLYVFILGEMDRMEMLRSYCRYSFLVSTSKSETFGLAIAEAIANGLPVVCTDSGGIRDFVDESNGIIVPIRNSNLFATAIVDMKNKLQTFDLEKNASIIISRFGTKNFKRTISNHYNSLIVK